MPETAYGARCRSAGISIAAALLWLVAPLTTEAGTVAVRLHDQHGGAIQEQRVYLRPLQVDAQSRVRTRMLNTGADGAVTFVAIPPGRYEIVLGPIADPRFVRPRNDPRYRTPVVTLENDGEQVQVDLELTTGATVVCRAEVDRGKLPSFTVRFSSRDHDRVVGVRCSEAGEVAATLAGGRWDLLPTSPTGFLLVGLELDGASLPGSSAVLDLEPGTTRFVTFRFSAPAEVSGTVAWVGREVPVRVEAHLVEPGPWFAAAEARGGSRFRTVRARWEDRTHYTMTLPDGRWDLRAVGDEVESVAPPAVDLSLFPGQHAEVDFTVRPKPKRELGEPLHVVVLAPDEQRRGRRAARAKVEIWPLDPSERRDAAIAGGWARLGERLTLRDVPAGDWIVAAADRRFPEGTETLVGYDPTEEPRTVWVRLGRGAELRVRAADEQERPVDGAQLTFERDETPEMIVREPRLVAARMRFEVETDRTGRGWKNGVDPGTYRVRGVVSGPGAATGLVRFRENGRLVESRTIRVTDGGTVVEATVVRAATIAATLRCTGGERLPHSTDVVVIEPGDDPLEDLDVLDLERQAERFLSSAKLTGEHRDRLLAGPLEPGTYQLALRPDGFDRWTWTPGTEVRQEATTHAADRGDEIEAGAVDVDCGPVIRLLPQVESGDPLPDLRDLRGSLGAVAVTGSVTPDGSEERRRAVEHVRVEARDQEVRLHDLPEGEAEIAVTLEHLYFVPDERVIVPVRATLARGRTLQLTPRIAEIGGALELRSDAGAAARLTRDGRMFASRPFQGGVVKFGGLASGEYGLELCADPRCSLVTRSWEDVRVRLLKTTELRAGDPEP